MSDVIIVVPPNGGGNVVTTPSGSNGSVDIDIQGQADPARLLAAGGTTGQVLAKASAANYDVEWVNQSGAGGSQQVFVQATQPVFDGVGIWIETGLSPSGTGFTFWFEDGL